MKYKIAIAFVSVMAMAIPASSSVFAQETNANSVYTDSGSQYSENADEETVTDNDYPIEALAVTTAFTVKLDDGNTLTVEVTDKDYDYGTVTGGTLNNADGILTIPSTVTTESGETITIAVIIDQGSFSGDSKASSYTKLKKLVISEGISRVSGFFYCSNLSELSLPSTLTYIGPECFKYCTSLKSVKLPEGITDIRQGAFGGGGVEEINVPDGIENLVVLASDGSYKGGAWKKVLPDTAKLTVNSTHELYSTDENGNLYNKGKTVLYHVPKSVSTHTLTTGVETIGYQAFTWNKLTTFEVPDGVTEIEEEAFANCTNLTNITIPSTVTSISSTAFTNCPNLTTINVDKNANFTFEDGILYDSNNNVVLAVTSSTEYVVSADATYLDIDMLRTLTNLETITVAEGNSVYKVQDNVLYERNKDEDGNYNDTFTLVFVPAKARFTNLEDGLIIPDNVTEIGDSAFKGIYYLKKVTLSDSVKTIGNNAFYECSLLEKFDLKNVEHIGDKAFYNCYTMTEITLPATLKSIGEYAFYGTKITSLTIPKSVVSLNEYFDNTWGGSIAFTLEEGNEVYFIQEGVMYENSTEDSSISILKVVDRSTTKLTIPEGVTTIDYQQFTGFTNLEEVYIPTTVVNISGGVFQGCTNLKKVTMPYYYTNGKWISSVLAGSGTDMEVVLLPSSDSDTIAQYTFYSTGLIKSVIIPDTVKIIDAGAFYNCTGLTSVTLPKSLSTIRNNAFSGCTGLEDITIPVIENEPAANAFMGCTNLKSVTFTEGTASGISKAFIKNLFWYFGETDGSTYVGNTDVTIKIADDITNIDAEAFAKSNLTRSELRSVEILGKDTTIADNAFGSNSYTVYLQKDSQADSTTFDNKKYFAPEGTLSIENKDEGKLCVTVDTDTFAGNNDTSFYVDSVNVLANDSTEYQITYAKLEDNILTFDIEYTNLTTGSVPVRAEIVTSNEDGENMVYYVSDEIIIQ